MVKKRSIFLIPLLFVSFIHTPFLSLNTLAPVTEVDELVYDMFEPIEPPAELRSEFSFVDEATRQTAVGVVEAGLRGKALGLPKKEAESVKDEADSLAKTVFQQVVLDRNVQMHVLASEGGGRDEVENSFMAGDVIGEGKEIHVNSDVIEGTNDFASGNDGRAFIEIDDSVAGAMSVAVSGDAIKSLGAAPDIYADLFMSKVPADKADQWRKIDLDPNDLGLRGEERVYIKWRLSELAFLNGLSLNDLEVVIMERERETDRLEALRQIQSEYPGFQITLIGDGTVAHALLAALGRKEGKHKVVWTVAAAPESFMNLAIAGALKKQGAIGGLRIISPLINDSEEGEGTAKSHAWRFNFPESLKEEIRKLRKDQGDAEAIIKGEKVFTIHDVKGDVDGAFAFITDSGVFRRRGVSTNGVHQVDSLRILSQNGAGYAWIESKRVGLGVLEHIENKGVITFLEGGAVFEKAI